MCNTGGLEVTTPYFPRTKPFIGEKKAKAKPKSGPTKPTTKPLQEPIDVDSNDVIEHDTDMGVNGTAVVANNVNAAIKHNTGRASKSGQQNEDGLIARLEEELRQVRFIGNYRPSCVLIE